MKFADSGRMQCGVRAAVLLVLLLLSCLFSGCGVMESSITPAGVADLPDRFCNKPSEAQPLPSAWWKALDNPELDALIEQGLENNLDIEMAYQRLWQAMAVAGQARAARLPWVGFKLDANRSHRPSWPEEITADNYSYSIAASYELDIWGKFRSRADAAEFMARASREGLHAAYMTVAAGIADLYYTAMEEKAQTDLVDAIIESGSRTLELVMNRYETGLAGPLDVYQARQTLESARARRPVHVAGFVRANNALSILLGIPPDSKLIKKPVRLPVSLRVPDAGIPAALLKNRPDIRAAWLRLKSFDSSVAAAVADLFPAIRIGAGAGRSRSEFAGEPLSGAFWNLLLGVAQPVFEGGRRLDEVRRQKARFREQLAAYYKTVLDACREVEDAMAAFRAAGLEIRHLGQLVNATQGDLRLSGQRYFWGLTEYLPVLTAQTLDLEARTRLIAAQGKYVSSWITLVRALGGTWPVEMVNRRLRTQGRRSQGILESRLKKTESSQGKTGITDLHTETGRGGSGAPEGDAD